MIVAQKYKVFINDKPVFFQEQANDLDVRAKNVLLNPANNDDVEQFIAQRLPAFPSLHIVGKNIFNTYFSSYKYIEAAGGVVLNSNDDILFIYRLKRWDLPKGKIETAEGIETAALREVEEECGVDGLSIVKELNPTYHTYSLKDKRVLKKTHWFLMRTSFSGNLVPQLEEDIELVEWMSLNTAKTKVFENTYAAVKDVLEDIEQ
jgi:8-oxo-dGTP pyrophosphatase MutT (NUDIX family)